MHMYSFYLGGIVQIHEGVDQSVGWTKDTPPINFLELKITILGS